MARTMDHEVFGSLICEVADLWEGVTTIELFGEAHQISIMIEVAEEKGIEQFQIDAFQEFQAHRNRLLSEVEQQLFDYYQSVSPQYRDQVGATTPDHPTVPIIQNVHEMSRLLDPESLHFPYIEIGYGLLFKCSWDPELGIAVKIEDGKVTEVGTQDILL